MESPPSPGKRTKRYCKKCNVIFGGESCPGKHPNFMWTKELPGSDKGLVIDVEEQSVLQKINAIQLSEGASEGPKSPGSPAHAPRSLRVFACWVSLPGVGWAGSGGFKSFAVFVWICIFYFHQWYH